MKYTTNKSLQCNFTFEGNLVLSVTGEEPITVTDGKDELLELLIIWTDAHTYTEAFECLNKKYYVTEKQFKELYEILVQYNLIKEDEGCGVGIISEYHKEKYKRQIESFHSIKGIEMDEAIAIQKRINQSKVCIIGVGGTGSHLALAMASIGVEKMVIVDFDTVELSNTSRQILYDENDIGRLKTEVAREKLKKYNSKLEIKDYNVHIVETDDLSFLNDHLDIDLLVLCADTPRRKIQYFVDEYTSKNRIPWFLYGPYHHSQIMVGPLMVPGKSRTYSELFRKETIIDDYRTETVNNAFVASICDPYNGFASQFAAIEAFKFLSGCTTPCIMNRRYYINTDTWEMESIDYD